MLYAYLNAKTYFRILLTTDLTIYHMNYILFYIYAYYSHDIILPCL